MVDMGNKGLMMGTWGDGGISMGDIATEGL